MAKATNAEVMERVEAVLQIRLDGAQFHDIRQYASEKTWGVSDRQLRRYVAASDRLLAARLEKDRDRLFARHVAQRQTLYARAVNAADYRTALAVARDEAELQGLYPPKKVAPTDPSGEQEYGHSLTDPERLAALQSLYARVGAGGGGPVADRPAGADGSFLGGPGADSGGRGDAAGPLAGGAAEGGAAEDVAMLFAPVG
jgi:hypothetical protein